MPTLVAKFDRQAAIDCVQTLIEEHAELFMTHENNGTFDLHPGKLGQAQELLADLRSLRDYLRQSVSLTSAQEALQPAAVTLQETQDIEQTFWCEVFVQKNASWGRGMQTAAEHADTALALFLQRFPDAQPQQTS